MKHYVESAQAKPSRGFEHFRQMFDEFYVFGRALGRYDSDVWTPATDVYETNDEIIIKMSLPGVKLRNIQIQLDGEVITICGFREWEESSPVISYHQMEIRNGYFERKIAIHRPFDPDGARAEYRDGFLRVSVPKADEPIERVVAIRLKL